MISSSTEREQTFSGLPLLEITWCAALKLHSSLQIFDPLGETRAQQFLDSKRRDVQKETSTYLENKDLTGISTANLEVPHLPKGSLHAGRLLTMDKSQGQAMRLERIITGPKWNIRHYPQVSCKPHFLAKKKVSEIASSVSSCLHKHLGPMSSPKSDHLKSG